MKEKKCILLLLIYLQALVSYAGGKKPPAPTKNFGPGAPGLQLPIDDFLPALFILALIIGIYYINSLSKTKNATQAYEHLQMCA